MYDIPGYEGHYKIDKEGNVFTVKRGKCNKLKKRVTKDGYIWYILSIDGKPKTCRAHRLVALTFIHNPENKPTVNHIDGNKQNNSVYNLEWATREEQMQHAYKLGLKKPMSGLKNSLSVLTEEQVREIRRDYKGHSKDFGMIAFAEKFGVSTPTIMKCVRGVSYTDVV